MRQLIFLLLFACAVSAFASEPTPRPTSRDPAIVLPLLRALPAGSTYQDACRILGEPNLDVGGAAPDALFDLTDGSRIHITTRTRSPDFAYLIRRITLRPLDFSFRDGEDGELLFDATPLRSPFLGGSAHHSPAGGSLVLPSAALCRRGPNHALQRTGHGGHVFFAMHVLRRHGPSLSLSSLGTIMASFLKPTADLATYEHHLYVHLGWFCSGCEAFIDATADIRAGEESAPEGPWAWRHAREAMESGWYLPPSDGLCLCPQCARARGLVMPVPRASA